MFSRHTFTNKALWLSLAAVIALQVAVTHVSFMQSLFDTTHISNEQWLVCIAVASSIVWVEELRKLIHRIVLKNRASSITPTNTTGDHS